MKARIYINRKIVKANKVLSRNTGATVDKPAIVVRTRRGSVYAKEVEMTGGSRLIQDALSSHCSGATIWIECEWESLIIDGIPAAQLENWGMKCPQCQSIRLGKNGHRRGKQCYLCRHCGHQFVGSPAKKGYPPEVRQRCLNLHASGHSLRAIEQQTGVSHNTVINWVRQALS
jgi:transposase-like protein